MSNDTEWIIIHKTKSPFEAEALKGNLETNGIPAVIINRKENSIANTIGYIEVRVQTSKKEDALELIQGFGSEN